MSLINIQNLTFTYEGSYDNVFEDVSFQIDTAWRLGFTGRNGRGKTTFLNLLLKKHEYEGSISASVCFEYFPFTVANECDSTVNVIRQAGCLCEQWQLVRELNILQLEEGVLYRPFKTLSSGERTKALLAALFLKDNSFLLIDEPTNHLDLHARRLVCNYLKEKSGFILVSHDRDFLDNCIDHILSINKVNIEIQRGNYTSWLQNREQQNGFELAQNERLKKEVKRLDAAVKQTAKWSDCVEKTKLGTLNSGLRADRGFVGHKAAKMMKRSKAIEARRENARDEKAALLQNLEEVDALKLTPLLHHSKTLCRLDNISIFYGDICACSSVSLALNQGERVALCGANGSGKSSVLKLILGEITAFGGEMYLPKDLLISYVSQDTAHLVGTLSQYALARNIDESLFKAILRKLDFTRSQLKEDMTSFSAGQKKKVLIAASLCDKAHLLLWDEPLNFIDIISRVQIEQLLINSHSTILFVEHDNAFCENVSTKRIYL